MTPSFDLGHYIIKPIPFDRETQQYDEALHDHENVFFIMNISVSYIWIHVICMFLCSKYKTE